MVLGGLKSCTERCGVQNSSPGRENMGKRRQKNNFEAQGKKKRQNEALGEKGERKKGPIVGWPLRRPANRGKRGGGGDYIGKRKKKTVRPSSKRKTIQECRPVGDGW